MKKDKDMNPGVNMKILHIGKYRNIKCVREYFLTNRKNIS